VPPGSEFDAGFLARGSTESRPPEGVRLNCVSPARIIVQGLPGWGAFDYVYDYDFVGEDGMVMPKTFDEHRAYLQQMVWLKLWFVWHWLRAHPEETFHMVLRERVDIYRKLDMNPGGLNPAQIDWAEPRWAALEAEAERLYLIHRGDANSLRFESLAFEVFRAEIDARARRDFADTAGLSPYTYGSIRFDGPAEGATRVFMHIGNTVTPDSIFSDPAYLPNCLLETMTRAEALGATELETFTWLNSDPRWLALFPAEWQAHLGEPDPNILWHYGFWGQFVTARGTFHARRAQQLRETGQFPYLPRASWCSFATLREHLAEPVRL
jgi:hypothetical protein